jgi:hypothetical protein
LPWGVKLEDEGWVQSCLAPIAKTFYTKIDFIGLLRGDSAARSSYYRNLREMGVEPTVHRL